MTVAAPGSRNTARWMRIGAWVLSVLALYLSASGWFMMFGLVSSVPAILLARVARARGPFIVGCAALVVALGWITVDRVAARVAQDARYCGLVGFIAGGGAVDEQGHPLDEWDEADKPRSYLRVADLAPKRYRDDWRSIADLFGPGDPNPRLPEIERRLKDHVKKDCEVAIRTF
jgi:hypothetical protein